MNGKIYHCRYTTNPIARGLVAQREFPCCKKDLQVPNTYMPFKFSILSAFS